MLLEEKIDEERRRRRRRKRDREGGVGDMGVGVIDYMMREMCEASSDGEDQSTTMHLIIM